MTTITLLKNTGIFVYDDYYLGRSALRAVELTDSNPVQSICRNKKIPDVVDAYFVKKDWFDTKSPAASLPIVTTEVSDDFMGSNVSNMINIINSRPETEAQVKRMVEEGSTLDHYKVYAIIKTKEFYRDGNDIVPFEDTPNVKVGGTIVAYLINPTLYAEIA